jgi:hypothetical protein
LSLFLWMKLPEAEAAELRPVLWSVPECVAQPENSAEDERDAATAPKSLSNLLAMNKTN